MKMKFNYSLQATAVAFAAMAFASFSAVAADFTGKVQSANQPITGSTVTLYVAASAAPKQLAQATTAASGTFKLAVSSVPADSILYVIARGGTPQAAADKKAAGPGLHRVPPNLRETTQ